VNNVLTENARKKLRVLIADDTAAIRDSLSALISRIDDVEIVGLAETGTRALELIRSLQPDITTLDIRMPGVSGINVLEAIRREKLNVTIIVLTGLVEAEYRRKCLALGASYFFHKATEFEMVIDVLNERVRSLNAPAPDQTNP
jgi:two-component system, response regulator YesN